MTKLLPICLMIVTFSLGCVNNDEFIALQAQSSLMEDRIQKIESVTLIKTRSDLSHIQQNQRNQSGSLDKALTRLSNMERRLDTLLRRQKDLLSRLGSLEKDRIRDRKKVSIDLENLSKSSQSKLTSTLKKLREDFNQAQVSLGKSWDNRLGSLSKGLEKRFKSIDFEITNFYKTLDQTIESYSSGTYIVKSGDNLSQIAQNLGISVEKLSKANNISDPGKIFVGQELIIPE